MLRNAPTGSSRRLHPTRHLLYAFVIGAFLTAIGFLLSRLDAPREMAQTTFVVAGSETLRPFMTECSKLYEAQHRGLDIVVRGGGSGTGIALLLAGEIDLALSSRELTSDELNTADGAHALRPIPVAREGIAVIAHREVAVTSVDIDQFASLLAGDIADWSMLGAQPMPVAIVGRSAGSGTALVVQERVLGRRAVAAYARLFETHEEVIDAVRSTPGAIGYVDAHLALTRAQDVQTLAVRRSSEGDGTKPSLDAVGSGKYPLARTLYFVAAEPIAAPLGGLIEHCTGPAAHSLFESAGYVAVPQ